MLPFHFHANIEKTLRCSLTDESMDLEPEELVAHRKRQADVANFALSIQRNKRGSARASHSRGGNALVLGKHKPGSPSSSSPDANAGAAGTQRASAAVHSADNSAESNSDQTHLIRKACTSNGVGKEAMGAGKTSSDKRAATVCENGSIGTDPDASIASAAPASGAAGPSARLGQSTRAPCTGAGTGGGAPGRRVPFMPSVTTRRLPAAQQRAAAQSALHPLLQMASVSPTGRTVTKDAVPSNVCSEAKETGNPPGPAAKLGETASSGHQAS